MELRLSELAAMLKTEVRGKHRGSKAVRLCTDSRALKSGQVFWALKGENFDGHVFANEAFTKGGYAAVVDEKWLLENGKPVNVYIPVKDTNLALLDLARGYAAKFRIPKVAVTGSNGKTTTKDMIARVLAKVGPTLSTQGNFNNQVGVPLTLFELKASHRFAVIEMGTNHPGEIAPLSLCTRPSIAVITNIGYSHLEHFGTKEKIREEKLTITAGFDPKGTLILNVDDPLLAEVRANSRQKLLTFGIDRGQIRPADLTFNDDGCASFRIGRTKFSLQVPGRHNVYNALAAIAVGTQLRIPKALIAEALHAFTASKNRMQMKKLPGLTVLDDCYNANPSSMRSALSTLGGMRAAGRRVAVLGDMLELGPDGEKLHREMGQYLVEMGVDELFTFGNLSRHINSGAREKGLPRNRAHHFSDFDLMTQELMRFIMAGDVVLVKGSRGMKLERVFEFLKEKAKSGALSAESRKADF
ncbi:MAG: UDP-N-acetylmuramoylalanyl-D-glutamyl-2,6-diaminopimelate/D-alanyl-D-alanyl ligase [Fibrobacteres bacterium]|nr:UDP-N-acetylmuramoylalanyl-D-glutamyl-2,6-diaminopimelate/D-alanyl-D-alanyl ligase [Fibrobacterota bacterium]